MVERYAVREYQYRQAAVLMEASNAGKGRTTMPSVLSMAMVGMTPVLCTSTLLQLTISHEDTRSWNTRPVLEQLSMVMAFTLPCTCALNTAHILPGPKYATRQSVEVSEILLQELGIAGRGQA